MLWPEDCELFTIHVKIEKPGSPAPAPPLPVSGLLANQTCWTIQQRPRAAHRALFVARNSIFPYGYLISLQAQGTPHATR